MTAHPGRVKLGDRFATRFTILVPFERYTASRLKPARASMLAPALQDEYRNTEP
jgi:hypothetical protein